MIADKLENTLNGGYGGLYGEVVTCDSYRLKTIQFTPDVVFDFGGNVGVFSRFARSLWNNALIVAVEPNPDNCNNFRKFTTDSNLILFEKAIGAGELWHNMGAVNGAHESYVSSGLGFDSRSMSEGAANNQKIEKSLIETVMPDEIINQYLKEGQRSVLKMDIEGGENIVFAHKPSMDAIKKIDFIAMEIHFYALTGKSVQEVRDITMEALNSLSDTHTWELDNVYFWATKKSS